MPYPFQDTDLENPAHPSNCNQLIRTERGAERIWHPDTPLFEQVQQELVNKCLASREEKCGLIAVEEQDIYYIDNIHHEPNHNFLMSQSEFKMVVAEIYGQQEDKVLGIFHTHPNNVPWPTPRDLAGWPNPALGWRYWIATGHEVIEWQLI
jgi:proteasome lid subunit RPN8/RPN11